MEIKFGLTTGTNSKPKALFRIVMRLWEAMINKYLERGSPCLIPLEKEMQGVGWKLMRKENLAELRQVLTQAIQRGGIPMEEKVARNSFPPKGAIGFLYVNLN